MGTLLYLFLFALLGLKTPRQCPTHQTKKPSLGLVGASGGRRYLLLLRKFLEIPEKERRSERQGLIFRIHYLANTELGFPVGIGDQEEIYIMAGPAGHGDRFGKGDIPI